MARIGNERYTYVARADLSHSRKAEVVFDVAGTGFGVGRCVLALEFPEDRLVRLLENVREHVDAPAVRHRDANFLSTVFGNGFNCRIEYRHHHVGALDREALITLINSAEETLETVDFRQPAEDRFFLIGCELLVEAATLDLRLEPLPFRSLAEVVELEPDIAGVERAKPLYDICGRWLRGAQH